ncbi:hypothetical protein SAMN02799630_03995 [Paenibacillus sp. UNCCL117]|uniref:hypothetical protein n=1 Tax=Paenibacillus sp. UNCCL117 TaxID=1502764 RepID=UPI0008824E5B|nr:hypothetical protein [Paenibacillus sp. UNCCL117]SDD77226.1 hypothetical protein SAMN04488602_11360 [Paenibacillus sp. cl123]SFW52661.1 hypothetical protein SAMN02799630_03995 [Paenibacillus sp. UNCCL117]
MKAATRHARTKAKEAHSSLIYEEDGKMFKEYPSGLKMELIQENGLKESVEQLEKQVADLGESLKAG